MSGDSSGRRPEGRGRAREPHRGRPRSRSRSRSPLGSRRGAAPARREAPERPSLEDGEPSDSGDELLDPASLEAETDHGLCRQIRHQYRALINSVQRKAGGGARSAGCRRGGSPRAPASLVSLGPHDLAGAGPPAGRHRGGRARRPGDGGQAARRAVPCAGPLRGVARGLLGLPKFANRPVRAAPRLRARVEGAASWSPRPGARPSPSSKAPFWFKSEGAGRGARGREGQPLASVCFWDREPGGHPERQRPADRGPGGGQHAVQWRWFLYLFPMVLLPLAFPVAALRGRCSGPSEPLC